MTSRADGLLAAVAAGVRRGAQASQQRPERLRVALDVELVLLRGNDGRWSYDRFTLEQPWARNPRILGLRMLADPHMPRGVWRILADDDTLLHDPREGMTLRQIAEAFK